MGKVRQSPLLPAGLGGLQPAQEHVSVVCDFTPVQASWVPSAHPAFSHASFVWTTVANSSITAPAPSLVCKLPLALWTAQALC